MRNQFNKPKWCSTAVPTKLGWVKPDTGELLVSIKGLENPIEGYVRNRPLQPKKIKKPKIALKSLPKEQEEMLVIKRGRGRPKKDKGLDS